MDKNLKIEYAVLNYFEQLVGAAEQISQTAISLLFLKSAFLYFQGKKKNENGRKMKLLAFKTKRNSIGEVERFMKRPRQQLECSTMAKVIVGIE